MQSRFAPRPCTRSLRSAISPDIWTWLSRNLEKRGRPTELSAVGYNGMILHVDLDNLSFEIEEPDPNFWRLYGGGGLLATYYLLKMTPPSVDAFNPRNLLIFTSSVVAGQPYAGLA